ncbi:ATP phosphoribosyltransferase regulatory subunit [Deferribacter abyssi]|uniref:ATP phosphoribosyltransferase regulatory subunit n=1 Tax=Deferribacter abyssi TaxID=213806 RepID=UPI003C217053
MSLALKRAKKLNKIIETLSKIFEENGYTEIFLPLYEFYDVLKDVAWDFKDENIIRFIDRFSGKSMVLRPDFTPQVCRFVSLYMKEYPLPIRVSYKGRVFRNVDLNKGLKSEKYQIGCELFGVKEFLGDTEILFMAYNSIKNLGIDEFKIIIGDSFLVNEILKHFKNNENILKCLKQKSINGLKELKNKNVIDEDNYDFLISLIKSFGDREVVKNLVQNKDIPAPFIKRLEYVNELLENLVQAGIPEDCIVFDASEMRGFDYYTGINFDIISSLGDILCGGGRYDNLMNKYGFPLQACGFAINVEELLSYLKFEDDDLSYDYLVVGEKRFFEALKLKQKGYKVIWVLEENEANKMPQYYRFRKIIK